MEKLKQAFETYEDAKGAFDEMLVSMDEGNEVDADDMDIIEDKMAEAELDLLNVATEYYKVKAEIEGNTEFTDKTVHDAFDVDSEKTLFLIEQSIK